MGGGAKDIKRAAFGIERFAAEIGLGMLQYVLTGLAGVALGIVLMRVWMAREPASAAPEDGAAAQPVATEGDDRAPVSTGRKLLLGASALVVVAIGLLAFRGDDGATPSGLPAPANAGQGSAPQLDDVDTMITRLAKRLEKDTTDGEGFRMLGWSYVMTGKPDQAIAPFKRAIELLPKNALVHSGYGEALVGVAGGTVTDAAKGEFDKALALDPSEPRSRYFAALWLAQHGKEREALEKWIALANSGPADAPWQADVQREMTATARKLGVDVSGRLKQPAAASGVLPPPDPAAVQAVGAMPPAQREATINQMVEGLASKLKSNPQNADGWARLLRSRMVLEQRDQAARDLVSARKALAGDQAGLAQVNAVAREVGVPGA